MSTIADMSTIAGRVEPTAHKRRVNELLHEGLYGQTQSEPVGFVCECSSPSCFATVWLSPVDYEGGRASPRWSVLAPGHRTA